MRGNIKKQINILRRSLLNIIFPSRTFKVPINLCIAETGHSYGKEGNHFFIQALNSGEDEEQITSFLEEYYAKHKIKSFNQFINDKISSPQGNLYFLPWEVNRIRKLEKFLGSHKAGPTPKKDLEFIVQRLLNLLISIKQNGFQQSPYKNNIIRVQALKNEKNEVKYLIRDGQHRLAVASFLGIREVLVTYESVYFFRTPDESVINVKDAVNWPKVKNGLVTEKQAVKYFNKVFNCEYNL